MAANTDQEAILGLLKELKGIDPLKRLFWQELNYDRANEPISTLSWTETERGALGGEPLVFATGGDGFDVLYCPLHSEGQLHIVDERVLINRLLRDHPYSLFVFSDAGQGYWHFVNVRNDPDVTKRRLYRRISVSPEERLRTATERISLLDIDAMDGEASALGVQTLHDSAFDVEAVTKLFFEEYDGVFRLLQKDLLAQVSRERWAHDYAQSFLNRLMFLYFVQRKGWVGGDREFVSSYWFAYKDAGRPADTFFEEWLKPLFFEAFNNKKSLFNAAQREYLPPDIRSALMTAPYLNGGLFREGVLDDPGDPFSVSDKRLDQILRFLDRYNFTIAEDSPLDQEVAVDPEMIGKVYESLVNVAEEADERGDAGIFYTARTEIDLMCRLALVDNLSNRIGQEHRRLLYELVFALDPEEKTNSDAAVQAAGQWQSILDTLKETTAVDPACGSGSFLVGMLHILDDLQRRAENALGIDESLYDRRKRIVGQSLYGVDVMEWACHVAELRLWLALIVDAQFTREELAVRDEPLLPNFTFNIRCGDSLVEEVAGIDLAHLAESGLSPAMKRRITELRTEKAKFYNCDGDCRFRTVQQAQQAERNLFNDIIQDSITRIEQELATLGDQPRQVALLDDFEKPRQATLAESENWRKEREAKQADIGTLRRAQQELSRVSGVPFVWRIAFAEVFHGEKGGFDIVAGNPPYVRQEHIADPALPREEVTAENKRAYKAKLALTTYRDYPAFFGYKPGKIGAAKKIGAKSDLYIYFYFRGLHLLNATGSFVFVTSNSWLDVGYGKDLQELLLRQSHVKLVLDNQAKRSFLNADINTIICLFSAPAARKDAGLANTARFVMFRVPFEQVVSAVVFEELEEAEGRVSTPEYKVEVQPHVGLLEQGCDVPSEDDEDSGGSGPQSLVTVAKYMGGKWGGKYLRAPDIYWTIADAAADRLVRLRDIADIRRGFTSGCNDFFYVRLHGDQTVNDDTLQIVTDTGERHVLPARALMPAIVRPGRVVRPLISEETADYYLVSLPPVPKAKLDPLAHRYVEWGESKGFHRRSTLKARKHWYSIEAREPGWVLTPMARKRRPLIGWNAGRLQVDHNLFEVMPHDGTQAGLVAASLFTTFGMLDAELLGRSNLGLGALKTEGIDIKRFSVVNPRCAEGDICSGLYTAFQELADDTILMIYDSVRDAKRQRLDRLFLSALGFEGPDQDEVLATLYDATCRMVWARMAKSGNSRETRMTYDEWLATGQPFDLNAAEDEE